MLSRQVGAYVRTRVQTERCILEGTPPSRCSFECFSHIDNVVWKRSKRGTFQETYLQGDVKIAGVVFHATMVAHEAHEDWKQLTSLKELFCAVPLCKAMDWYPWRSMGNS